VKPCPGPAVGWLARLRGDWLFWGLAALVSVLALLDPACVPGYPALVDWHTIAALSGLLVLNRGLDASGGLHRLTHALLRRVHTERTLALSPVLLAAALPTVITNDVALDDPPSLFHAWAIPFFLVATAPVWLWLREG
jgi:di/tricarboxylate transporter